MQITFHKYHGTGNDFIMIDNRVARIELSREQIVRLCDRRFGIGSDGLILIENDVKSTFYMNFYNPDGSQSFCGNGSRCAVKYAMSLGIPGNSFDFRAIDGKHIAIAEGEEFCIKMKDVDHVTKPSSETYFANTGSPHIVAFCDDVKKMDLITYSRKIRYSDNYKREGVNVNVVEVTGKNDVFARTYERGVEDETLSCGTGVTAVALIYAYVNQDSSEVKIETKGGYLKVRFNQFEKGKFSDIWLCGPAVKVYEGRIEL